MDCSYIDVISEDWLMENCGVERSDICTVEELSLTGNIRQKVVSVGRSLVSFLSLRELDLSRNHISSLDGLQFCQALETVNLYYNNISAMSEVTKLARNAQLRSIDLRLNPVCVMSTEYRLLLVHALPKLQTLDTVAVSEKDRALSLSYHSSDQADFLASYRGEGVAAGDFRLRGYEAEGGLSNTPHSSVPDISSSCESFIRDIRPPLSVLQPKRDAYDAFSTRGTFTPNPKKAGEGKRVDSPMSNKSDNSRSDENLPPLVKENRRLRNKYKEYKEKYNQVLSERISKESYVKLQEDYYKSLQRNDELEQVYNTTSEEIRALKQHVNELAQDNRSLKQELSVRDQVGQVDADIKERASKVAREGQRKARSSNRRVHKEI